jgi:hypothetical protein
LRAELEGHEPVKEIASASSIRTDRLFKEIKPRLELFLPRFTLGSPHSTSLTFHDRVFLCENTIRHVDYFGRMGEAVYERLAYEFYNAKSSPSRCQAGVKRGCSSTTRRYCSSASARRPWLR